MMKIEILISKKCTCTYLFHNGSDKGRQIIKKYSNNNISSSIHVYNKIWECHLICETKSTKLSVKHFGANNNSENNMKIKCILLLESNIHSHIEVEHNINNIFIYFLASSIYTSPRNPPIAATYSILLY